MARLKVKRGDHVVVITGKDKGKHGEVLKVIHELADEGRSMVLVTHEIHFARDVADWVIYMGDGGIVEEGPADKVLGDPQHPRTRSFLRQILEH